MSYNGSGNLTGEFFTHLRHALPFKSHKKYNLNHYFRIAAIKKNKIIFPITENVKSKKPDIKRIPQRTSQSKAHPNISQVQSNH